MEQDIEMENMGAENDAFFVIKAGGDIPDDVVKICRTFGLFKE